MQAFNPAAFTADSRLTANWGGGWSYETLPTNNGWLARPAWKDSPNLLLIGRRGVKGCATVRRLSDALDVAIYLGHTPEEIIANRGKLGGLVDEYIQIPEISGWTTSIMQTINRHLAVEQPTAPPVEAEAPEGAYY